MIFNIQFEREREMILLEVKKTWFQSSKFSGQHIVIVIGKRAQNWLSNFRMSPKLQCKLQSFARWVWRKTSIVKDIAKSPNEPILKSSNNSRRKSVTQFATQRHACKRHPLQSKHAIAVVHKFRGLTHQDHMINTPVIEFSLQLSFQGLLQKWILKYE